MNNNFKYQSLSLSDTTSARHYLYLFLIWPFLAFLLAIKNYSQKDSKKVVYLFIIYYGLTFVIGELGGAGADAERYAMHLIANAKLPFTDFFKIVGGLYSADSSIDIVEPLISFLVSRFTSHYSLLFAVYAAIFGFFYLKSINLLHDRHIKNPGWNTLIMMVFFIMILPINSINGFRMWTAAWIFFYGAYHVILYRNPKYILITLGASLVHFSFLTVNIILILYYVAGNRNVIYFPLVIVSFILPHLLSSTFRSVSFWLGGAFLTRYEGYSSEGYGIARAEEVEQAAWFMQISDELVFYYLIGAIIIIQLRDKFLMQGQKEKNLFSFLLLFLSFVNFGKAIPSFGGRFEMLFYLFATLYIFIYLTKLPKEKINILIWIGLFPMLLFAAINFRLACDSINIWLFTPGFGLPLLVQGIPLADILFN